MARRMLLLIAVTANTVTSPAWSESRTAPYLTTFPHFNAFIQPSAPGDIDTGLQARLSAEGKFALVQREFELYAWQIFLAVNLPAVDTSPSLPKPALAPQDVARWESWISSSRLHALVALGNGASTGCPETKPGLSAPDPLLPHAARVLTSISTSSEASVETIARSSSPTEAPLVDQRGNFVFYETVLDPNQYLYICQHHLLSFAGQRRLATSQEHISFPSGSEMVDWSGSYSLKLAWKVLDKAKGDNPGRYYVDTARILDLAKDGRSTWRDVQVGLVGMHIVHKTQSAPERIWATFEQVDNISVDAIENPGLLPSFYNPFCPLCAPNQANTPLTERKPTQAARVLQIPVETESLNAEAEAALAARGSVWRYYKLIGVQWPGVPGDITSVTPRYLANIAMETFIQPLLNMKRLSVEADGHGIGQAPPLSCMTCHAHAHIAGSPSSIQQQTAYPDNGDFSWFLSKMMP